MEMFQKHIKPILPKMITGDCIPVEGTDEEIAKMLDQRCGVDVLIDKGDLIFGLGSRIQIDSGVWNTFTIRCDRESGHITELEKLRKAIKNESIRPQFTLHAYIENDMLKSVAIARTRDIINYLDNNEKDCPERMSFDKESGKWAKFRAISWDKMKNHGYRVIVRDNRRRKLND